MKKIFPIIAIGLLALPFPIHASGEAFFYLEPESKTVYNGEIFSVKIIIDPNASSLDTAQINLRYSTGLLDVISATIGQQFPVALPDSYVNENIGTISLSGFNPDGNVDSVKTFADIVFKATAQGIATIHPLESSRLISGTENLSNYSKFIGSTITVSSESSSGMKSEDNQNPESSPTPVQPQPEPTSLDIPAQQRALGYFGTFAGRMPTTAADWAAHECMWRGGCWQLTQGQLNIALEAFETKFGRLPQDVLENYVVQSLAVHYSLFGLPKSSDEVIVPSLSQIDYGRITAALLKP